MTEVTPARWELAAETIAVKIRWFGLFFGYMLVNLGEVEANRQILNTILALGVVFAVVDTGFSLRGRVLLGRFPLVVSLLESLFIGLLCYFHDGLESGFRYFYILSLIGCAIRHSPWVTFATWALHSTSYLTLFVALPASRQNVLALVLTLVLLGWVTWASLALALLLKRVGAHLAQLNGALKENQALLEERIAERTHELKESQAHVLHQEKIAAFGLLAAGIAHEVGNPLASISSLVQMLQRRDQDDYTREKLGLVNGQLQRIQTTLRELVNFSRPASRSRARVDLAEVVDEALHIAKYYTRTKSRRIDNQVPAGLPAVMGVRDQLVQVILNLVLNAIDATGPGGAITLTGQVRGNTLELAISDEGAGILPEHAGRLFQPYFTTKKHGTGLGLFVTRKLISDHGGSVDFTSSPGSGTTFHIHLPLAPVLVAEVEPVEITPHAVAGTPSPVV